MKRPFQHTSDDVLVAAIRKGERPDMDKAFEELYTRYSSRIHAYCYKVLNGAQNTQDIFQDTFIRFYHSCRSEAQLTNIPGFLLTIARNLCLNAKRDTKQTDAIESYAEILGEQPNYENNELLDLLNRALDLLPADHKEAFVLKEYGGYSHPEIAEMTGTTLATAKTRVFRARQRLKEILQPIIKDLEH